MRVHKAVPIHLTVDDYREVVAFCEARELRLTAALQVLVRSGLAAEAGAVLAETFAPATTPLSGFRELARAADSRNGFVLPTEQEARAAERERAVAPLRRVAAMDDLAEHLRGMLPASVDPGRHRYPAVPATPPEAGIDPEAEPAAVDSPQEESSDA